MPSKKRQVWRERLDGSSTLHRRAARLPDLRRECMVTTLIDHETQRSVWVPKLIAWAAQGRDHYEAAAHAQRRHGHLNNAADYLAVAADWSMVMARARVLLVELELPTQAVGLADACAADPEPPDQLVPFVDWLKLRFGALLPGLSVETWQAIGCLILMARGIRP